METRKGTCETSSIPSANENARRGAMSERNYVIVGGARLSHDIIAL
jgi:hypothetical protein